MWITKLHLSNIKSYGGDSPPITFRPGVNLIQGRNGAGKSTILEAIGLALFGSRTYTHEQFVREGARSGEIVVGFMSGVDEREYEVVRGVGSGAKTYVYDPSVGRQITTGIEDTAEFIRRHLRVDAEADLAALFRDAVGVPQGAMTAIFLEPARLRSETFNRLLRIDEYERVWKDLLETERYLADLLAENANRQARLEGSLSDLPAVTTEIERLSGLVAQEHAEVHEMEVDLAQLDEQVSAYDTQKQQLDSLDRQVEAFRAEVRLMEERLERAADQAREAQEAAAVLTETESGYEAFERAQEVLAILEADRLEREQLLAERGTVHTDLELCRQDIARAEEALVAVEQAEVEVERLTPLVEKQAALEEALNQSSAAQARYDRLQPQITQVGTVLVAQEERLARLEERLAETQEDLAPVPDDTPAAESLEEQAGLARDVVGRLDGAVERLGDALNASRVAMADMAHLEAQVAEREGLQARLDDLTKDWEAAGTGVNAVQVRLAQITQEQQTLADYESLLSGADARCPVCQRPMDAHAYADSRVHFTAERERLQADAAAVEIQLTDTRAEFARLTEERDRLEAQIAALPGDATVEMTSERLSAAQASLEERRGEVAQLWGEARAALDGLVALLSDAESHLETLVTAGDATAEFEAELDHLGDPRRDFERALEKAAERASAAAALTVQQARLDELQARFDALGAELDRYADLNERLLEARQLADDNQEAHQRYLARRDTAQELPDRQSALAAVRDELQVRQEALRQTTVDLETLAADYDVDAHDRLRSERDSLNMQRVALQARVSEHEETLQAHRQRLAQLEETRQQLAEYQAREQRLLTRQEAFTFVRSSIRQAGPKITEQLVQLIGEQANHIFADILGDPGMVLYWSQDYGISVSCRGERRDFALLSGGEQMAAAMAIRLALLTQLADVRFAFFDEPTANLDETRRDQLAQSLSGIHSLQQLFVISHDDTFEQESYHVVQVRKVDGVSQVETL